MFDSLDAAWLAKHWCERPPGSRIGAYGQHDALNWFLEIYVSQYRPFDLPVRMMAGTRPQIEPLIAAGLMRYVSSAENDLAEVTPAGKELGEAWLTLKHL